MIQESPRVISNLQKGPILSREIAMMLRDLLDWEEYGREQPTLSEDTGSGKWEEDSPSRTWKVTWDALEHEYHFRLETYENGPSPITNNALECDLFDPNSGTILVSYRMEGITGVLEEDKEDIRGLNFVFSMGQILQKFTAYSNGTVDMHFILFTQK